jgi:HlyD family secretion protein
MSNTKRNYRNWIIVILVIAVAGFFGWRYWQGQKAAELPPGIAAGNGRIEAKLVDVSAKEPLRVKEILVQEGDLVQPGQIVVRLDSVTLDAQLAESQARVAAAREQLGIVNASIARRQSEIALARIEVDRVGKMLAENASSQREYDVRKMTLATTNSSLAEERAKMDSAKQQVTVAEANVATVQTRIDDATLVSPVLGRVLYRLVEPGEVLGAGGKALTLVNLEDVYMEIFLPSAQAAAVKVGSEGRITVDYEPGRAAAGYVTFVSPEAQFTPKEVETKSERDKLMFRVKIQIPKELVGHYIESIKTGVRGMGYVKVDPSAPWPPALEQNLLTAGTSPKLASTPPAASDTAAANR